MATFEITTPDGKVYHAEGDNAEGALAAVQKLHNAPTTLNIDGRRVTVDDSFHKLSPDDQNSTVDQIAKSLRSAPQGRAPVTNPALLAQLNAPEPKGRVTDPALLAKLNGDPIHIGAPDGSIVEFPGGTSDDTIKSIRRRPRPPNPRARFRRSAKPSTRRRAPWKMGRSSDLATGRVR
jgi:hypothetical protein